MTVLDKESLAQERIFKNRDLWRKPTSEKNKDCLVFPQLLELNFTGAEGGSLVKRNVSKEI